jgi:hypothetical protein
MATQLLPSVRDLHAEQEDHIKKINRYLAGLLDHSDDWSISEVSVLVMIGICLRHCLPRSMICVEK